MVEQDVKSILEFNSKLATKSANTSDLHNLIEYIIAETINFIRADSGSIMVYDFDEKCLKLYVSSHHPRAVKGSGFKAIAKLSTSNSISGQVFSTGEPVLVEDASAEILKMKFRRGNDGGSFLSAPLKINKRTIGVMNLNRSSDKEPFSKNELTKLSFVDTIIASLIEKETLVSAIAQGRKETVGLYKLSCILSDSENFHLALKKFLKELSNILKVERTALIESGSQVISSNKKSEVNFNLIAANNFPKKKIVNMFDSVSANIRLQLFNSVETFTTNDPEYVQQPLTLNFSEGSKNKELFCFPIIFSGRNPYFLLVSRNYHAEDIDSAQRLYRFLYLVSQNLRLALEREEMINQIRQDKEILLQNATQNQIFLEISKDLTSTLDPRTILRKAFDQFRQLIKFSSISILLYDDLVDVYRLIVQPAQPLSKGYKKQLVDEIKNTYMGFPAEPAFDETNFARPEFFHPQDVDEKEKKKFNQTMKLPIIIGENVSGMIHLAREDKQAFSGHELDVTSQFTGIFVTSIKNAMIHKKTEKLAFTDTLTELYNHRYFQETLSNELIRSTRYSKMLSLMMIDIDFFKKFNDTYGHLVGDKVLRHVAKIFKTSIREQIDTVARYGGEEFVVILPETSLSGAINFAERIREAVEKSRVINEGEELSVTLSIGVSCTSVTECKTPSDLIAAADLALYKAKDNGRNQVSAYNKKRVEDG